jgi:murein L,D-transpeptidase YcbB/YkuD
LLLPLSIILGAPELQDFHTQNTILTPFLLPFYLLKVQNNVSSKTKSNRKGAAVMSKKIVQVLIISVISAFLVASAAAAQTAKQPTPVSKAPASSEVKAKKTIPNETVKAVQEALDKEGYKLKADGLMGKHTRNALKSYQKKNGLKVTGKIDEATLAKLNVK